MTAKYSSHRRSRSSTFRRSGWFRSRALFVRADDVDLAVLSVLLVLIALGGGSAFADTLSLIYVRLAAVAALAIFMLTPARSDWATHSIPLILLALLAVVMIIQLVPLPPSLWTTFPGRAPYLEATSGLAQPWRPLSLTPDLTFNSLVSLIVPAAVLAGFVKLDVRRREWLLMGFIVLCAASMVIGIAQMAGGGSSALYLYKRTYEGTAVGLLANRNHQAAMLAALFPVLRVWTLSSTTNQRWAQRRSLLALALGVVTVPVILATGSRQGIALGLASLAVTLVLFPPQRVRPGQARMPTIRDRVMQFGIPALLIAMVLLTWQFGRALSIQRLTGGAPALEEDLRVQYAPLVARIIEKTFPIGTGFGSFDPLFRQYEPDAVLKASFFNHAHNEVLEIAMTAGIAGLALLVTFIVWWLAALAGALRNRPVRRSSRFVLLGGTITGILMAASLVDYPLRTPLLEAWFTIACCWMCTRHAEQLQEGARA